MKDWPDQTNGATGWHRAHLGVPRIDLLLNYHIDSIRTNTIGPSILAPKRSCLAALKPINSLPQPNVMIGGKRAQL